MDFIRYRMYQDMKTNKKMDVVIIESDIDRNTIFSINQ